MRLSLAFVHSGLAVDAAWHSYRLYSSRFGGLGLRFYSSGFGGLG